MNQESTKTPWLRISVMLYAVFGLLLVAEPASAGRCERLKATPDTWVATQIDALVLAARRAYESDNAQAGYEKVLDRIVDTMRECKFTEDKDFVNRYRTFVEYVDAISLDRKADHELGFLIPDQKYFAETRQFVEIPKFLLEPTFVRNVSRYETLEQAKSYLRQLNSTRSAKDQLIFFSYESRHLGTPDNDRSFRRLLIVVPGNAETGTPDKWVQFGVPDPGMKARVRNISIVSAVTREDGTFNAYFKDFYRTYRRNGSITIDGRWELGENDDNCAMCHKSGILPIFPVQGSVNAAEQQFVLAVNERFRGYGSPRFGGYLDPRKLGPGLSSASSEDRQQRFGPNFAATSVASAMVCSACHNAERLGALSWPMDSVLIKSYVTGGQMPFGHKLKSRDRSELYAKLIEEYFATDNQAPGILKLWLQRNSQEGLALFRGDDVLRGAPRGSQQR